MSLGFYTGILADQRRIDGVREGLAQAVHPGDKVLEVGTGLGTFAFFAVQAGADHVWAVDRDPVIHVAEMLAKTNGLHDRITFLRGEMSEIALPDQVDLLVCEDFAVRLLDDRTWRLIRDAQSRHLKPGGRVFPEHVRLNISLAGGSEVEALLELGDEGRLTALGLDWSCLRPYLANTPRRASGPRMWAPRCLSPRYRPRSN